MKELEVIKDDILNGNFSLSKDKMLILDSVYFEVTKLAKGKGKILNKGCSSCMITAYKIISNYIKFHWQEPIKKVLNPKIKIKKI